MKNNHKILITTGIYPPKIGGPAQYAKNLKETFEKAGSSVVIKTFGFENHLPSGLRHLFFFLKIIPSVLAADVIFIMDNFSVALPSVLAGKIFGKKTIIRNGGDFLWEQYVERTKKKVLFGNFYQTEIGNLSKKEKIIFRTIKWILNNASFVVFSADWQRRIFLEAYEFDRQKTFLVENYFGPKEPDCDFESKKFIASARKLFLKNIQSLEKIFKKINTQNPEVVLFSDNLPYDRFLEEIKKSYAVILVSLGDISPNIILDAIRFNKPFVCTREVGIYQRIKDIGIFVDPMNEREIENAIINLLDENEYKKAKGKIKNFNFIHTWDQIAAEFLEIANKN